jgi:hypothetical protein
MKPGSSPNNPVRTNTVVILLGSLFLLFFLCFSVPGLTKKLGLLPTSTPTSAINISAVQTSAVQTIMANLTSVFLSETPILTQTSTKTPILPTFTVISVTDTSTCTPTFAPTFTPTIMLVPTFTPAIMLAPTWTSAPIVIVPSTKTPRGPSPCCKHCGSKSQPCGDSCISKSYTCRKPPGCACG